MRVQPGVLAGNDRVGLAALVIEVEDELEAWGEAPGPVARHPGALVPDVPGEPTPALGVHPGEPSIPVRHHLVVAVDEAQVYQDLAVGAHRQTGEDPAHQGIPVVDTARGVAALVGVGRRGEAQPRLLARHQGCHHGRVGGVAAQQAMVSQGPQVAQAGHRHRGDFIGGVRRIACLARGLLWFIGQEGFDLRLAEAGEGQVEVRLQQLAELQGQKLFVPARVQGQTVVGDDVGLPLRWGQVLELDDRHVREAQLPRCRQAPVPRDQPVLAVHQQRIGLPVLDDARGDVRHLRGAVGARIAGARDQRRDRAVLDVERQGHRGSQQSRPVQVRGPGRTTKNGVTSGAATLRMLDGTPRRAHVGATATTVGTRLARFPPRLSDPIWMGLSFRVRCPPSVCVPCPCTCLPAPWL